MAAEPRAAERLERRLAEAGARPGPTPASRAPILGMLRRGPALWTIEIVDRTTGRVVGIEPCEGGVGPARGLLHVMRADLERLGIGAFLRRWGCRPR